MPQLNRAAIDKQRAANNLPPLTDEEFTLLQPTNGTESKEKENTVDPPVTPVAKKKDETEVPAMRELTEEELLARISERTGRNIASWDDIKPTEAKVDEEAVRQQRDEDKITWALRNKVVKQNDYENNNVDRRDAKYLVYHARVQETQKQHDFNQEEYELEFSEEFGLDQKPESRSHKNGQNSLNRIASDILKTTYGSI